mmetsp:Transcript_21914/g.49880  ORF Transcript_21914/g.49880 Transcript_21914/m.49880 type:complete len:227 (-) Transcript_21914:1803-2483(-)
MAKIRKSLLLASLMAFVESFSFVRTSLSPRTNKIFRTTTNAISSRRPLFPLRMTVTSENTLTLSPIKSIDGTVTLPGSKSLSNRCLLLAALSDGTTRVENLLESDDIRFMLGALDDLGVEVVRHSSTEVTVTGRAGPIDSPLTDAKVLDLFLGNAGTAMRPLAAALCMGKGKFVLDGVPRMRERPIADLIDGLVQLGADVSCSETGCPPVVINADGVQGGEILQCG